MPVAEKERIVDEDQERKPKAEVREGEEPPPGTYFAQYVAETEEFGPCIIRCNNKMWLEIKDAGEQEINKDRIFYQDEIYADGEFIVEPRPEGALEEETPPPPEQVASERPFLGDGTASLTVDQYSEVESVAIEADAYPLPAEWVAVPPGSISAGGADIWQAAVNVLVTAMWLDEATGQVRDPARLEALAAETESASDDKEKKDVKDKGKEGKVEWPK